MAHTPGFAGHGAERDCRYREPARLAVESKVELWDSVGANLG